MRSAAIRLRETPRGVWVCALLFFGLQFFFGPRYPVFRDEFYYLACADHLAWGYVDHPPLSIMVLWAWRAVFGDSLHALRFLPSLAGAGVVLLTSLLTAALGGGRFARTLSATAVLAAPVVFGITSFYSMNAFDFLFWLASFLFVARLAPMDTARATPTWVFFGLVLGLGLLNKISILVVGAGLAAALLLTPMRAHLRRRGPWIAAAIALALFAPHILWQVQNDWPTREFIQNAAKYKNVALGPWGFFKSQILDFGPVNSLIWIPGFVWLMASARARPYRGLGLMFVVAFVSFMNGKAYYLAPAMLALLAAGPVWIEGLMGPKPRPWIEGSVLALWLVLAALPWPLVVPILPPEDLRGYTARLGVAPEKAERSELGLLPQHFADRFGWEELTSITVTSWRSLSDGERRRAVIVTSNYGEAGALNYYGRDEGLPRASSQHNNFYLWGPTNPAADVAIVIGVSVEELKEVFEDVRPAAAMTNRFAMPYERENPVSICRRPKRPLMELWVSGKKFI